MWRIPAEAISSISSAKGWQAEEISPVLCAILPLNVWIYAGGLNNLRQAGKKYILQGGNPSQPRGGEDASRTSS